MRDLVLMPEEEITYLESLPSCPTRLAAAHTLPRELGGDSPEGPQAAARMMASVLPRYRRVVLAGQQHVADQRVPEEFARHVLGFLTDDRP